jgi:hypothetical protein
VIEQILLVISSGTSRFKRKERESLQQTKLSSSKLVKTKKADKFFTEQNRMDYENRIRQSLIHENCLPLPAQLNWQAKAVIAKIITKPEQCYNS